jgi:hypothetical protein
MLTIDPWKTKNGRQLKGHPRERRILGSDRFLERLKKLSKPNTGPLQSLESLVHRVCDEHGVTLDALRSPSRERKLRRLRTLIDAQAVKSRIAYLSDVARYLNRSVLALSRALR